MGMPSGMELFIIVGAIVLLFGGKKIPELAKGLGQGIKNFKKAVKDDDITQSDENKEIEKDVQTADVKTAKKEEAKV
ncbi:MAG: Sec-independent protein translocase TatA [Campylobacteraceae bacterium 4484_166]|nr:MAG: Sec-independent protein translocase TatA [Campylobacteraceae bacterium 4484_166]